MKIALVTGASRGIGFETARQLAQAGAHVFLSARNPAPVKVLQAEGLDVEALTLDVTDAASIGRAVDNVALAFGCLDILINNAGVKIIGDAAEDWSTTFSTNLFGMIGVTRGFLPLLRQSDAGRIVNVSSSMGALIPRDCLKPGLSFRRIPDSPSYAASKTAVNMWTIHLAKELRGTKIKVNAAHPGEAKTRMSKGEGRMTAREAARTSVALALLPGNGPTGTFVHMGKELPW